MINKTDQLPANILIMKVGPHSNMSLNEIIKSKQNEEVLHGVHYWGYSGVFCQPKPTQKFCNDCLRNTGNAPSLILMETKSPYHSSIGEIKNYSANGVDYCEFKWPVQLQGAQFSLVARNLRIFKGFNIHAYKVVGGKNDGKPLSGHLKFRVNKSFACLGSEEDTEPKGTDEGADVLIADLVDPFAIWLKE